MMKEQNMQSKQRFFSALSNVFLGEVGSKLEGNSGYTNLMKIRNQYFNKIKPLIEHEVSEEFQGHENGVGDLYNKLYTFFDSYLNETGTPFYNKTQLHKNLYEKIYSDKEDTSLFWKTQKLFYVKSEAVFTSMEFDLDGVNFEFDASEIEYQKNNEKKEIEFLLVEASKDKLKFKVEYKDNSNSKYERLKKYLNLKEPNDIKDYLFNNISNFNHPNIIINKNELNLEHFTSKTSFRKIVRVKNMDDALETVVLSLVINSVEDMGSYLNKEEITVDEDLIKKAIRIYKKQKEVDYFIHKDASSFLKEQFNIFIYDYLFNEKELDTLWDKDRIYAIQKIKKIAFKIIDYIGKFENELKAIWLKPRLVKSCHYVITLDRIDDVNIIRKIIESEGFENQIEEWKWLYEPEIDEDTGQELKGEMKEFEFALELNKDDILVTNEDGKEVLNDVYKYLPIDTRHFEDIKFEILSCFSEIDNEIDGVLIKSENYQALNDIVSKEKGEIQLIYIDPPFNTGDDFDYKDEYQDSTWLTIMNDRLNLSSDLLSDEGSLFLHLGEDASYYGRMLLDRAFGKGSYLNNIIWAYNLIGGNAKKYERNHEYITWYAVNPNKYIFNKDLVRQPYSKDFLESLKENEKGELVYTRGSGRDGERLNRKKESKINPLGKAPSDIWDDIAYMPPAPERLGFGTQKPEELLYRVIAGASNEGGKVLDFFSGSGTTISVAHKLKRKWIGVEMGEHFYTKILPRLKRVLKGDVRTKVSKKVDWQGGGFFKYYELEQYEDILKKSKYIYSDNNISNIFYDSEKLLDAINIEEDKVTVVLKNIYNDVDIAETISNLSGKKIKSLTEERVTFTDNTEVELGSLEWESNKFLRPLIWWGEKDD